jgi:uncharacterized protein (TIGR00369 family)
MSSAPSSKIDQKNVEEKYAEIFADWVKAKGLSEFQVTEGFASAVLRQNPSLQWAAGAICGQAIMSAIDTVASLCASTSPHGQPRGTVSQNNQFIRPAFGEDLLIEVNVLNFGKTLGYFESRVVFLESRKLVAHATLEFMY